MGYYIRVLGKKLDNFPLDELRRISQPAVLSSEGEGDEWMQLILSHKSGPEIAVIEKNLVVEGELGAEELQELTDEVPDHIAFTTRYGGTPEASFKPMGRDSPTRAGLGFCGSSAREQRANATWPYSEMVAGFALRWT